MPNYPTFHLACSPSPGHVPHQSWHKTIGLALAGLAVTLMLSGCAGPMAYRKGKELVENGQVEAGLHQFEKALQYDPRNVVYRETYLQTRERATYRLLQQADQSVANGKPEDAENLYRQVLAIDPDNVRAKTGLDNLARDARHADLLKEAKTALDKRDLESLRLKLSAILVEDPQNQPAREMQRVIENKNTAPTSTDAALAVIYRKPITIEFKDGTLKQIFEVISRSSGLNFLFDKDVKTDQRTSIFLKKSTIEDAIHFTLLTNQLEQRILNANTVLIYPSTAAKQKDYQEVVIKSFFLANAEAKTVANTLKTIVKARDVIVDDKLNMLIVRDTPDAVKQAEKLIALQDVPEPEVMMEVEILEVNRTRLTDLGIQWPSSLSLAPIPSTSGGTLTLDDLLHLNKTRISAGSPSVTINANSQNGDAKILANPRIRARNHEKAKILIGERIPNITTTATSTGFVAESINYVDVGLKLEVEPTVYLDNDVAIRVSMEVSNLINQVQTKSGSLAYNIGTRNANTVLRLKDGENQILAGLINDEDRKSANQVPGLGNIPVLGRLFGSTNDNNLKTEIVLSITPHIVRNIRRPDAALAEFRSGTESNFHVRTDSGSSMPVVATPPSPPSPIEESPAESYRPASEPQPDNLGGNIDNGGFGAMSNSPVSETMNDNAPVNLSGSENQAISGAPASAGAVQFQWQGPAQVKVGDTVTLQLMAQSSQLLSSIPLTIGFDSKVLQVISVDEGDFLKQGNAQTSFSSRIDPNGQIQMNDSRSGGSGAAAQGIFATIAFRVLAPTQQTQVQILNATPAGPGGLPVTRALPPPFTLIAR